MSTANKLTYLNETKKKIKNTINYAGAGIASDTFRSYPETLYNTYADILNGGTEDLFNGIPHVTGSGTNLSLNNSAECKMQLNLKGNTSQESTTGKNLLNIPDGTQESNGITFVVQNGEITINGTATATTFYQGAINLPVTAEKYSWSANNPATNTNVLMRFFGNAASYMQGYFTTTNKTQTETFESAVTLEYLVIRIASGTTLTNFKIKPQFEKGNPTSYEPYTNGQSPNPDYPQDIHVVSGDNTIKVEGKNLFSGWTKGKGIRAATGEIIDNTTGAISDYIPVNFNINPNYYISGLDVNLSSFIAAYNSSNQFLGRTGGLARESGLLASNSFTSGTPQGTGDIAYVIVYQYKQPSDTGSIDDLDTMPTQLEKNNQATEFEPYTGARYPINLPVENLIQLNEINLSANTITDLQLGANLPVGTYNFNGENITADGRFNLYGIDLNDTQENLLTNELTKNIGGGYSFTTTKIYKAVKIYTNIALSGKIQLEKGTKANHYTPYGATPIELCKIGDYKDTFIRNSGKNLFNKSLIPIYSGSSMQYEETNSGAKLTLTSNTDGFVLINLGNIRNYENKTLTFSMSNSANNLYKYTAFVVCDSDGSNRLTIGDALGSSSNTLTTTIGSGYSQTYLTIRLYISGGTANTSYILNNIMINEKSTALPYEPYGNGEWYKKGVVGKVVLTGANIENWQLAATYTNNVRYNSAEIRLGKTTPLISNYFLEGTGGTDTTNIDTNGTTGQLMITIPKTIASTVEDFKTWLSTHNTIVYYILATPTYTKITDTTLANQLEDIYKAKSYNNQTNISQTSADLSFVIDATAALDYDYIS